MTFEEVKKEAGALGFTFGEEFEWEWEDVEENEDTGGLREIKGKARAIKVSFPADYPHPPHYLIIGQPIVGRTRTVRQLMEIYHNRFREAEKLKIWDGRNREAEAKLVEMFRSLKGER